MLTLLALHTLLGVAQAAFPCDGAATDGDIYWAGVLHDSFDKTYREPFGAAPAGGVVELRLRACRRDLSLVRVRVWDAKARKETWISLRVAAGVVDPDGLHRRRAGGHHPVSELPLVVGAPARHRAPRPTHAHVPPAHRELHRVGKAPADEPDDLLLLL